MNGKETENIQSLKQFYGAERPDAYTLEDLRNILRILRSDEGCPWDRKQTFGDHGFLRSGGSRGGGGGRQKPGHRESLRGAGRSAGSRWCSTARWQTEQGLFAFEGRGGRNQPENGPQASENLRRRLPETDGNEGDLWERIKRAEKAKP